MLTGILFRTDNAEPERFIPTSTLLKGNKVDRFGRAGICLQDVRPLLFTETLGHLNTNGRILQLMSEDHMLQGRFLPYSPLYAFLLFCRICPLGSICRIC